jgi:hypothetical protein
MKSLLVLILFGLTASLGCGPAKQQFHLGVMNIGKKDIDSVVVSFDGYSRSHGIIISGADKTEVSVGDRFPIPVKVTVQWTTEDGQKHIGSIDVRKEIPEGISRVWIRITINDENQVGLVWEKMRT